MNVKHTLITGGLAFALGLFATQAYTRVTPISSEYSIGQRDMLRGLKQCVKNASEQVDEVKATIYCLNSSIDPEVDKYWESIDYARVGIFKTPNELMEKQGWGDVPQRIVDRDYQDGSKKLTVIDDADELNIICLRNKHWSDPNSQECFSAGEVIER